MSSEDVARRSQEVGTYAEDALRSNSAGLWYSRSDELGGSFFLACGPHAIEGCGTVSSPAPSYRLIQEVIMRQKVFMRILDSSCAELHLRHPHLTDELHASQR
jgi:hypothetical protein